jgi:hypothetical protein
LSRKGSSRNSGRVMGSVSSQESEEALGSSVEAESSSSCEGGGIKLEITGDAKQQERR